MKYKTSELKGMLLDAAVRLAESSPLPVGPDGLPVTIPFTYFEPSSKWDHGGPIIESEGIELWKWSGDDGTYWCAHVGGRRLDTADQESFGHTPLVAAMRAFVHARLGDAVDL